MEGPLIREFLSFRWELYGYIRSMVRNTHDAEDLFQEVAAVMVEQEKIGTKVENFPGWVREIARRRVLDFYKKADKRRLRYLPAEDVVLLAGEVGERHPFDPAQTGEEYDALRVCLGRLSGTNLEMVKMRFMEDRDYTEIAARVKRREGAVRQAVSRVREFLAGCIEKTLAKMAAGRTTG
ncbi:MAG: sigma-70 family RNA polymerase sigma factor [Planctomycetota bacterium]